ncbi:MAG TPA: MATE family efflux transporter, partial [Paludibacteraceae bacterium]|nr:MATE family efflux transporter [Paludibacteraceae bacterium]
MLYTKNIQELESQSIGKLLWHYSFPTIVGTLVNALYNVVDRIFIGQGVGAYAISGLALTFPIMMILGAFGMLVGQGAATHISIALGKKENETANKILGNAFVLTLIVSGSVISLMYLFLNEILIAFG